MQQKKALYRDQKSLGQVKAKSLIDKGGKVIIGSPPEGEKVGSAEAVTQVKRLEN